MQKDTPTPCEFEQSRINTAQTLIKEEIAAGAITLALACFVAAVLDAPLNAPISPEGVTPENVRAPWIFLGIQQLLRNFPPLFAGILVPLLFLVSALAIPFFPKTAQRFGKGLCLALLAGYAILTLWGFLV